MLEAEVVVQMAGEVLLHAEEQPFSGFAFFARSAASFGSPAGSGVEREVALLFVFFENHIESRIPRSASPSLRSARGHLRDRARERQQDQAGDDAATAAMIVNSVGSGIDS